MQSFRLVPHPACRPDPSISIEGMIWRDATRLDLEFQLRGDLHHLVLPEDKPQVRADGLWQSTCFEAFLRPSGAATYFEINMAPSSEWASYRFDTYRAGMREAPIAPSQDFYFMSDGQIWEQDAAFTMGEVAELESALSLDVGIAAVVEEWSGRKSYWALAHPDGPPDFHHPDCFALTLPPINAP